VRFSSRVFHILALMGSLFFAARPSCAAAPRPGLNQSPAQTPGAKSTVAGTVSDPTGMGVAGVTVTLQGPSGFSQSASTDGQGQYSLSGLPPGSYNLSASTYDKKSFEANLVLSAGQLLTLGAGIDGGSSAAPASEKGAILGTVANTTGAGAAGVTVQVSSDAGASQSVPVDAQGQYAAADLAPGVYSVSVVAKGAKVFAANVLLSPGQVVTLGVKGPLVAQSETPTPLAGPAVASATAPAPAPALADSGSAVLAGFLAGEAVVPTPPGSALAVAPAQASGPAQVTGPAGAAGGTVSGSVSDQTGAVVVGATVKLSGSGVEPLVAVTDSKGAYRIKGVPAGTYSLSVTAPNFKPFQTESIQVAAGADIPLDAPLEPAAAKTEEVNVEASNAAQVETLDASLSGTITQKEVSTLGLNGRNFTQLITLTPGVSNQTGQDEAKVGVNGSVKYSVNGGRVEYNSFEVDGSDVLNAGLSGAESTLVVYPSLDAIQEVKVLTSNYGAQYGRTASGTVEVTTKSGGAQWHGNAYEFIRNEAFNARNYFDQPGRTPFYRRNDFGVTIGGPLTIPGHYNVNKDKTFVFFSEEVRIEKSPSELEPNFNHAVPTLGERQGNFSDVCPSPNDPQDLRKLISLGQPGAYLFPIATFPDCPGRPNGSSVQGYRRLFASVDPISNTIVYNNLAHDPNALTTGLDPNAVAILNQNLVPLPNSATGCSSSLVGQVDHTTGQVIAPCYVATVSLPTHWHEELFRIDHNFNPKFLATFRFIHDSWDTVTPTPNWGAVRNSFPTVQNDFVGPGIDMLFRLTQRINPTLINETVFSFTNAHITLKDKNGTGGANFQRPDGLGDPTKVGQCTTSLTSVAQCPMGYFFNNGFGGKVPGVILTGNNQAYGGSGFAADPSYMPWEHTNPTYNVRDDMTKSWGKHTFQFGAQWVIAQKNEVNGALGAATGDLQGLLTFSNVNGGSGNTGNAFANFLYNNGATGTGGGSAIQSYTQDSAQTRYYNRYQTIEPYIQDDWKVSKRLTVNLGVRFSLFENYQEKYRNAYNWDPAAFNLSLATKAIVDPSTGQLINHPGFRPVPLDTANVDPRIINGIVRCGENNVPFTCAQGHVFNPAPRVGFAWDPFGDGKTSIRAGYGMFFEHGTGDEANTGSLEGSAPLVLSLTQDFPTSYACIGLYGPNCSPTGAPTLPGAFPINVTGIPTKTKYSNSQQWSLSIQRELPHYLVATASYVGSKGTHLTVERQLNQLNPLATNLNPFGPHEPFLLSVPGASNGDCDSFSSSITNPIFRLQNGTTISAGSPAWINMQIACQGQGANGIPIAVENTFRPYYTLGKVFSLQNVANSSYHGFQFTLRRTKGPLTAGVAYSFSHSIDEASDRTDPTFVNSLDLRSNRASSNFDQRHLLNISYVYSVPKFSTVLQRWLEADQDTETSSPGSPSRLARVLADGWQLSGITSFQTGTPFSVINNAGSAGIGVLDNAGVANGVGAGSYPDLASDPAIAGLKTNASSFGPLLLNPSDFVAPRGLTFGNAGRNSLNNPSRLNFDVSLLKHFAIHEGSEVEFRMEAFNVFNHTQFRIYNPDRGNTGSNTVSCYGGPNYSAGAYFPGGSDCLTGSSFLHPVDAHRPRTLQFGVKYSF
jgi:hypothetical protein